MMAAMTNPVDMAERKGRVRARIYLVFAVAILLVLIADMGAIRSDFVHGLWVGITMGSAINMLPWGRWLKPGNAVARLLDDESAREHRRMSATAGFWAAMISALALSFVTADGGPLTPFDVARVIATAAMAAAMISFAVLELRAARG